VTSAGVRYSKGTPIIINVQPRPFYQRKNNERRKKNVLTLTNIWPWVPVGLDAKSDHAGCLPAVSHCSALQKTEYDRRQKTYRNQKKSEEVISEVCILCGVATVTLECYHCSYLRGVIVTVRLCYN
jgi:hypothetical protein